MTAPTYCIIHCRVSTARQAREGDSLEVHASICRGIAERNGWTLAHEPWLEAHTGSASVRPVFNDVLAFLDQNPGLVRYYLFRSIDRFTRGGVDLYAPMKRALQERGVEPIDSMGVIQPTVNTLEHVGFEYEWSRSKPSEIAEVVLATTANSEKTTILTRMIGQQILLAQKGYRVRYAADGYELKKVFVDGKRRHIQEPDPKRAKFYTAMFELRAAGQLSDKEIVARINAMGYRRPVFRRWDANKKDVIGHGGGGPLTVVRFQQLIRNPIYCGVVCETWTHWRALKAPYPGLVSIETYNAANRGKRFIREQGDHVELLYDHFPDRQTRVYSHANALFPFKNVIMCPTCQKPFHASVSRGASGKHFPAYHCARAHKRVSFSKQAFEDIVRRFVENLRFNADTRTAVMQAYFDRYRTREKERGEARIAIKRTIADLEVRKAGAVKAFLAATSDTLRRALEAEVDRLEAEIAQANSPGTGIDVSKADLDDYLADVQKTFEHPLKLLENPANTQAQRSQYRLVFNPLPTIQELDIRTAKLTPIFRLCSSLEAEKFGLADQPRFSWNSTKAYIKIRTGKSTYTSSLSSPLEEEKSRLAGQLEISWNEIEAEIIRWKEGSYIDGEASLNISPL